jgi:hypothetical protein
VIFKGAVFDFSAARDFSFSFPSPSMRIKPGLSFFIVRPTAPRPVLRTLQGGGMLIERRGLLRFLDGILYTWDFRVNTACSHEQAIFDSKNIVWHERRAHPVGAVMTKSLLRCHVDDQNLNF